MSIEDSRSFGVGTHEGNDDGKRARAPSSNLDENGPALLLEPDGAAARALEADLYEYGFRWIAIVHEVGDARRLLVPCAAALAVLSLDLRRREVVLLAEELTRSAVPVLLTARNAKSLAPSLMPARVPLLARRCPRDMLFATIDRLLLRHSPT